MNRAINSLAFFFVGSLIVGLIGYFAFHGEFIRRVFAHVGGASVVGLLGVLAGHIAQKNGFSFKLAFTLGSVFSLLAGGVAAFLAYALGRSGHLACGGSVSLLCSFIVIVVYALLRKKKYKPVE